MSSVPSLDTVFETAEDKDLNPAMSLLNPVNHKLRPFREVCWLFGIRESPRIGALLHHVEGT